MIPSALFMTHSQTSMNSTVNNSGFEKSNCIDHHVYDKLSDTWVKQHSKLKPVLNVTAKVTTEDYAALGFHLERDTNTALLLAMADTGCQSCHAGLKVLHRLGLRLAYKDEAGSVVETRKMTYITDSSYKLFLSWEACTSLVIITDTFPTARYTTLDGQTNSILSSHPTKYRMRLPKASTNPTASNKASFPCDTR